VAPFADDQVVMTDGTTTARVDASGHLKMLAHEAKVDDTSSTLFGEA
jgi:hypothetical protein